MREPYQVLLLPFVKEGDHYLFAIFKRQDLGVWQGISGGGEEGETPLAAVKREAFEEAGIDPRASFVRLASFSTTPAVKIRGLDWGREIIMIPEFTFGVELNSQEMKMGNEHLEYRWCPLEEALEKLEWESNKAALWELNHRLKGSSRRGVVKNLKVIKNLLGNC